MRHRQHPVDIRDVVAMLAARIEGLCAELLPEGVREGPELRIGSPLGEPGRSMAVHLKGAKQGIWSDFSAGVGGDALDLVAAALFQGDKKQALKWSRQWLGIDDDTPETFERARADARRAQAAARKRQDEEEARRAADATKMWLAARKVEPGDPVWLYLAGRGIDLGSFPRIPGFLRYHPGLRCVERGVDLPAMVCPLHPTVGGKQVGLHRTWLEPDGAGGYRKASLKDAKKTFGRLKGCAIPVWKGASGKPISQAKPGEAVIVTEGVEDALTLVLAGLASGNDWRVVAAYSVGNMASLTYPDGISEVLISADADPELRDDGTPHPAFEALARAVANIERQGKVPKVARQWAGRKDANDLARLGAEAPPPPTEAEMQAAMATRRREKEVG